MKEILDAITGQLPAVIGGLLVAGVSGYLLWRNTFSNRRASAAAKFRATFADDLSRLRNSNDCPADILSPRFPAHEAAVTEYVQFLRWFRRKSFVRAWHQYAYHDREKNLQFLTQYSAKGQSVEEKKRRRDLAIARLNNLLSYAEHA